MKCLYCKNEIEMMEWYYYNYLKNLRWCRNCMDLGHAIAFGGRMTLNTPKGFRFSKP